MKNAINVKCATGRRYFCIFTLVFAMCVPTAKKSMEFFIILIFIWFENMFCKFGCHLFIYILNICPLSWQCLIVSSSSFFFCFRIGQIFFLSFMLSHPIWLEFKYWKCTICWWRAKWICLNIFHIFIWLLNLDCWMLYGKRNSHKISGWQTNVKWVKLIICRSLQTSLLYAVRVKCDNFTTVSHFH